MAPKRGYIAKSSKIKEKLKMKRCLLILLAIIICGETNAETFRKTNAETFRKGKNDLEIDNLKGDVVSVTAYHCAVREALGKHSANGKKAKDSPQACPSSMRRVITS